MTHTIQIYNKHTEEVIETKQVARLKSFLVYWHSQCNTDDFAWREVE